MEGMTDELGPVGVVTWLWVWSQLGSLILDRLNSDFGVCGVSNSLSLSIWGGEEVDDTGGVWFGVQNCNRTFGSLSCDKVCWEYSLQWYIMGKNKLLEHTCMYLAVIEVSLRLGEPLYRNCFGGGDE